MQRGPRNLGGAADVEFAAFEAHIRQRSREDGAAPSFARKLRPAREPELPHVLGKTRSGSHKLPTRTPRFPYEEPVVDGLRGFRIVAVAAA
jgi:hypothetical protein